MARASYHATMSQLGYVLQIVGLGLTGYAAVAAFSIQMSEGAMFTWGLGGVAAFFIGTSLRGRQ